MSWSWWPENDPNGEEHEGWVQPIFGDGEEGTGTTCAAGIIQHTEYDGHGKEVSRRVRPFSEVTQLRVFCSCGWTGPLHDVDTMSDADLDRRWMEPTEQGEAIFLNAWRAHLAPLKAVDDLGQLADEARELDHKISVTVDLARAAGASWQQIGRQLGMTKQGAQQRYGA